MSDFGYVKDAGLVPARGYAARKKTDLIIEHHSSTPEIPTTDAKAIEIIKSFHRTHVGKGNRGIDYNYLVAGNGSVFDGRGLEYEGGHVKNSGASAGMNARSVGICAIGDFEHNQMPEAQKEGLKRITRDVAQHYGITNIIKHKEVSNTDCPGKLYPFDEIVAYALSNEEPRPTPTPPNRAEVETFVRRQYVSGLGRQPDSVGWNSWVSALMERRKTPKEVSYAILFSNEGVQKKPVNKEFVETCYLCLLNRKPDKSGEKTWLDGLYTSKSRIDVFNSIANSAEFRAITEKMGLQ